MTRAVAAVFALAAAFLVVESLAVPGGWLPLDEAGVVAAARGDAAGPDAPGPLLPLLLLPFARLLPPPDLYDVARSLGALLWAALAVPTYLLARRFAPTPLALGAAAAAALVPASVFALAVVPDALAALLAAWSFVAAVRAAETGSRRLLGAAVALAVLAALARPWLALLPLALLLAHAPFRSRLRVVLRWPASLAFAAAAVAAYVGSFALGGVFPGLERALGDPELVARASLASIAPFAIGVGVVPLLLAGGVRREPLTTLLVACAPLLALSAGLLAAGREGAVLDERPLAALTPLLFALAAAALARLRLDARAVAAAGAVLAAAIVVAPDQLRDPVVAGAPGYALLSFRDELTTVTPVAILAVLIAVSSLLLSGSRGWLVAAAAVALVGAQVAAVAEARSHGERIAERVPSARDWLDRFAQDGATVPVLAAGEPPAAALAETRIWNRSLGGVVAVDPLAAQPETGVLPGAPASALAVIHGFEPAGTPLAASGAGILYRLEPPLRVAETVQGVHADGWSGGEAVYRRFAGSRPGVVRVTVSRRAASSADIPRSAVAISTGTLAGATEERARRSISPAQEFVLDVRVPTAPFRVVVTVSPTFSPADFGGGDTRELGVQLGFEYRPG